MILQGTDTVVNRRLHVRIKTMDIINHMASQIFRLESALFDNADAMHVTKNTGIAKHMVINDSNALNISLVKVQKAYACPQQSITSSGPG